MAKNLTDRQREVLSFMIRHEATTQAPATGEAIGKAFGITQFGAITHFKPLQQKGFAIRSGQHYAAKRTPDYWLEWLAALPQQERCDLFTEVLRQFIQRTEKT